MRRRHGGTASEQDATPAGARSQQVRGQLHGHLPGDFAHRRQHWPSPALILDDLQTDRGDLLIQQFFKQCAVGHGHVIEGQNGGAFRRHVELVRGGDSDLHQQTRAANHFGRRVGDLRAGAYVIVVGEARADAGVLLHPHAVAALNQVPHHGRCQRHAAIRRAPFARDPNDHRPSLVRQTQQTHRAQQPRW